jgi:glyoxalase family protein
MAPPEIRGNHHLTFCAGPAQEDYDFHTKTLGLRSIKKTALYDGEVPIYHLYYANAEGDAGAVLTSFPMHQQGIMGRLGTNQISRLNLSVPTESLAFWAGRLRERGIETQEVELYGTQRLHFSHPCGLPYGLVADGDGDPARSWEKAGVPAEHAFLGSHGIAVDVAYPDEMIRYLEKGLGAREVASEGASRRFQIGTTGRGRWVEVVENPESPPGTWFFGEGTVHHCAWDIVGPEPQLELKGWLEGLGYTDCTEVKDRGYFMSVYNRTPGGALFEYAWSKPEGWTIDEEPDHLGEAFKIPPPFMHQADYIMSYLEPIETAAAVGG